MKPCGGACNQKIAPHNPKMKMTALCYAYEAETCLETARALSLKFVFSNDAAERDQLHRQVFRMYQRVDAYQRAALRASLEEPTYWPDEDIDAAMMEPDTQPDDLPLPPPTYWPSGAEHAHL